MIFEGSCVRIVAPAFYLNEALRALTELLNAALLEEPV